MSKLPQIKPLFMVKLLTRQGFQKRTTKSSHLIFTHRDGRRTVIPVHNKPIPKGTLRAILKQINMSVEEFLELL